MSLGWMFLILGLLWLSLLAMLVVAVRQWLAEEIGPALDGDAGVCGAVYGRQSVGGGTRNSKPSRGGSQ